MSQIIPLIVGLALSVAAWLTLFIWLHPMDPLDFLMFIVLAIPASIPLVSGVVISLMRSAKRDS